MKHSKQGSVAVIARQGESLQQLASDPSVKALLKTVPRFNPPVVRPRKPAAPRSRPKLALALFDDEMRKCLDEDPFLKSVSNEVLRVRERSEFYVRLRVRAIAVLSPRYSDGLIAGFLRMERSGITYIRHTRLKP